jgi:hypothetical protein
MGGWMGGDSSSSGAVGNDYGMQRNLRAPDYSKTPEEEIRLDFPFAVRLAGETVSSIDYEMLDGLAEGSESGTGSQRSVLVSGGNAGNVYRVTAIVVTSGGRTLRWTKRVLVVED